MRTFPRVIVPVAMIGTYLIAGCTAREDVVGPREEEQGRELTRSDCGYEYTVTVTPDTVTAPGAEEEPTIVDFLVDIDEDGCLPNGPIEDVWVSFSPSDSGTPTGFFIIDSLPEGSFDFFEQEGNPERIGSRSSPSWWTGQRGR